MKRTTCILAVVLVALWGCRGFAEQKTADSITVRIVPTSTDAQGRNIHLYKKSEHFYVVITNVSGNPIRLWREWNSWGYDNLSFVLVGSTGRNTVISKRPIGAWAKNSPDSAILAPGDHMVIEVTFDDETAQGETMWLNAPAPETGDPLQIKMKAVYAIVANRDTKKYGIWTGRAFSPEDTYTISR